MQMGGGGGGGGCGSSFCAAGIALKSMVVEELSRVNVFAPTLDNA